MSSGASEFAAAGALIFAGGRLKLGGTSVARLPGGAHAGASRATSGVGGTKSHDEGSVRKAPQARGSDSPVARRRHPRHGLGPERPAAGQCMSPRQLVLRRASARAGGSRRSTGAVPRALARPRRPAAAPSPTAARGDVLALSARPPPSSPAPPPPR